MGVITQLRTGGEREFFAAPMLASDNLLLT